MFWARNDEYSGGWSWVRFLDSHSVWSLVCPRDDTPARWFHKSDKGLNKVFMLIWFIPKRAVVRLFSISERWYARMPLADSVWTATRNVMHVLLTLLIQIKFTHCILVTYAWPWLNEKENYLWKTILMSRSEFGISPLLKIWTTYLLTARALHIYTIF